MKKSGKVQGVTEGKASNGNPFWKVTIDGRVAFTTFKKAEMVGVEPGVCVEYEVEKNGDYWNLVSGSVKVVDEIKEQVKCDPQVRMLKFACLKAATAIVCARGAQGGVLNEGVENEVAGQAAKLMKVLVEQGFIQWGE